MFRGCPTADFSSEPSEGLPAMLHSAGAYCLGWFCLFYVSLAFAHLLQRWLRDLDPPLIPGEGRRRGGALVPNDQGMRYYAHRELRKVHSQNYFASIASHLPYATALCRL